VLAPGSLVCYLHYQRVWFSQAEAYRKDDLRFIHLGTLHEVTQSISNPDLGVLWYPPLYVFYPFVQNEPLLPQAVCGADCLSHQCHIDGVSI
jgi:hypothetical protein